MRAPLRILIPLDYSEPSVRALEYGVALAGPLGASVTVFHAYGQGGSADQREHAERLDGALRPLRRPTFELRGVVRWSPPTEGIHLVADEIDAELVIMGTHGRKGVERALLGSVTESVLRDSARPIVTIPPAHDGHRHVGLPARILVATDLGATSEPAVDYAVDLAARVGARVTLLHVCASARALAAARPRLDEAAAARGGRGAAIDVELRQDDPARAINDLAGAVDADLIVLGTRGRTGLARAFAGSVAEAVIRAASRPVLTLHTPTG